MQWGRMPENTTCFESLKYIQLKKLLKVIYFQIKFAFGWHRFALSCCSVRV